MLAVAAGSYVGVAQRKVELIPGNSGIPVAPRGRSPNGDKRQTTAIARMRFENNSIVETTDIYTADLGTSKIAFGKDGKLYVTSVAVGGNTAQDLKNVGGKVLRLNDDGSVPKDNPFV